MPVSETTTPEPETDITMSLRLPSELDQRVRDVAQIIGLKKPEVYRLAIKQGVETVLMALSLPMAATQTEEAAQ